MTEGRAKHIFLVLRVAVVAAGIAWAAVWVHRDVGWQNLADTFLGVDLLMFSAALVMYTLSQVVVALRWWMLLRTQRIFISLWAATKLHFLGTYYNNFLPSAVGGDIVRAWYVTRHTDRGFEAVLSVFIDRVLGFASMILLALGASLLFMDAGGRRLLPISDSGVRNYFVEYETLWLSVLAALAASVFLLCLSVRARRAACALCVKAARIAAGAARKSRDAFLMYCRNPITVLGVVAATMLSQSILIVFFWLLGKSMGIEASAKYYFVFFPASWVLGALPVSIGGAVVVEGWLVYLFVQVAGAGKEQALVLALCQRFIWMLASLPGAAIHLFGAHLPERFSIDETGQTG